MMKFLRFLLGPKKLNELYTLLTFSRYKTERIPCFDKIAVYIFYRFCFFHNRFLRTKSSPFVESNIDSTFTAFKFSEDEVLNLEKKGITPVFNLKPAAFSEITKVLDDQYLIINGKKVKKSVESIGRDLAREEKLSGLYPYPSIAKNPKLVEIGTDPALVQFVSRYLRSDTFTLDILAFWSFPNTEPIGNQKDGTYDNAQNYHFDHTSRRCLKFFCYLTDCGMENGPHSYIAESHINKPFALQAFRLRLRSEELERYYKKDERWQILTGTAGTSFIMDPFGTHRGLEPVQGSRLLIQFMYSIDNFRQMNYGTNLTASEVLRDYRLNQ
jgi:hypothetical protein